MPVRDESGARASTTWLGLLVLTVSLTLVALRYATGTRARTSRSTVSAPSPLSVELLRTAERSLAESRYRLAAVEAAWAVDLWLEETTRREATPANATQPAEPGAAPDAARTRLGALRRAASDHDITGAEAAEAITLARRIMSSAQEA